MRTDRGYADSSGRASKIKVAVALLVLLAFAALVAAQFSGEDVAETSGNNQPEPVQATEDPDTGLPIGRAVMSGMPVGFPKTELGAIAAVVELNRAQIGFDPDAARQTVATYADPGDLIFFEDLALAAIEQRRKTFGLPPTGNDESLAPAAYAQTPIGYQAELVRADTYLVSVLNLVTTTTLTGEFAQSLYVGQQFVSWNGYDWKLVEPNAQDRELLANTPPPQAAQLGTEQFDQAGWTPLLETAPFEDAQ